MTDPDTAVVPMVVVPVDKLTLCCAAMSRILRLFGPSYLRMTDDEYRVLSEAHAVILDRLAQH